MAVLDIRQRAGYLFLAVVLGHIILISAQVQSKQGVPVLHSFFFGGLAEVQRAASASVGVVQRGWQGYIGLRGVRAENESLKRQLADAQVDLQQQRALANRNRSLQQLLDLRDSAGVSTSGAEIIAASTSAEFRTVTIDKGSAQGLRTDMAVISPAGIVGRIVVPSVRAAKVQLLIDRNAAAGALIERSRAQGVAVGTGDSLLQMEFVPETADIVVGDRVVTSGIDAIYPKGFVIGDVAGVEKSGGAYKRITIKPAVDFSSLEEVLVVLTPSPVREAEGHSE